MTQTLRTLLAVTMATCVCWLAHAGTASGTLEVNGKTFTITHAYGIQVNDPFEKGEKIPMLLLSDRPLPEKLLEENVSTFDLRDAGMNGLKMDFSSHGSNYSMMIVGAGVDGSFSSSGTFDASQFTEFEPAKIAGNIVSDKTIGDTTFKYSIKFDTEVLAPKPKVKPSAEQTQAAQNAASAKAYLAHNKAMREGNLDAIRASVVPERAAMMDNPDFKEMLGLIQAIMPSDIAVVKATETGDSAELELAGKNDGQEKSGIATLKKINGKWLMERESWK